MTAKSIKCSLSFPDKANKIHNDKYDYSLVVYTKAKSKVEIVCPIHGSFFKTPNKHLQGQGCPTCGNKTAGTKLTKPFINFVTRANEIHYNKYAYQDYVNAKTAMTITCPTHGDFKQTPDQHINKKAGCPKCSSKTTGDLKRSTKEEFVTKANKIHGDTYSYANTVYTTSSTNVEIVCKTHGSFWQSPSNHLSGKGCRKCRSGGGFDTTKPSTLYYIAIDGGTHYKIGVTNRSVFERFSKDEHQRITVIKTWDYPIGQDALMQEKRILTLYKEYLHSGEPILRDGNTEIFIKDVLELVVPQDPKDF